MSNLHLHKFKVERVAIRGMAVCYRVTSDEGQITLPVFDWYSVFQTMKDDSEALLVARGIVEATATRGRCPREPGSAPKDARNLLLRSAVT